MAAAEVLPAVLYVGERQMKKEVHNDIEALDAEKVDEAFEHVFDCDYEAARSLLEEVIKNTPGDYQHACEKDGKVFIKFWNSNVF